MTRSGITAGCLPLALALSAGANTRHSIGTGIIGGMIGDHVGNVVCAVAVLPVRPVCRHQNTRLRRTLSPTPPNQRCRLTCAGESQNSAQVGGIGIHQWTGWGVAVG